MTFAQVLVNLNLWLRGSVGCDEELRLTIEVPINAAPAVLYRLKRELEDLLRVPHTLDIDFNKPMRLMGHRVEFKIIKSIDHEDLIANT